MVVVNPLRAIGGDAGELRAVGLARRSKTSRNVAAVRFFLAHTSWPVQWSTTHCRYR
jgi:hypothetical protein